MFLTHRSTSPTRLATFHTPSRPSSPDTPCATHVCSDPLLCRVFILMCSSPFNEQGHGSIPDNQRRARPIPNTRWEVQVPCMRVPYHVSFARQTYNLVTDCTSNHLQLCQLTRLTITFHWARLQWMSSAFTVIYRISQPSKSSKSDIGCGCIQNCEDESGLFGSGAPTPQSKTVQSAGGKGKATAAKM